MAKEEVCVDCGESLEECICNYDDYPDDVYDGEEFDDDDDDVDFDDDGEEE